jgi:hypothetical protein
VPGEPVLIDLGALGPAGSDQDEPWPEQGRGRTAFWDMFRRLLVAVVEQAPTDRGRRANNTNIRIWLPSMSRADAGACPTLGSGGSGK